MANRQYTSVLDLAFTTGQLAAEIIDWQINENKYSGSDHEVVQFSITTEDIELVDSPFNAPFNIQKANWAEFNQQLVQESQSMLTDLRQLETQDLNQEQMETIACSLRDLITKAAEQNIPRRKPCSRSKVWWNPNLTLLQKEMAKQSRIYKRHDQSQQQWTKFARCRTEYFYAIKTAKRNSWTKILSEANGKEVFQAYKYTKPKLMEKIPPIQTADGKLCHTFNDKCQTFIKAMYPKPPEISQNPDRPNAPEAQWNSLTNNEVKQAIFTSSPKKAAGPDEIGFAIIQEAYKAIAEDTFAELADLRISEEDRDLVVKKHLTHIRQLIDQNHPIFYTDGSKLESNVNSQVKASLGAGIYWIFGKVTSSESHFLGHTQEIMDAEIYAIVQAIERIADAKTRKKHFWVFTDSQSAIQNLQKDQMRYETKP
ncbi:Ribonuclease H-like domain [Lasallia pustulata]|uniref:Ribonuclease H-like domain n=1 Tax=Lasallia pustulata TaxID=136370 RepID=A0A1W5DEC9_9LECA|nr:Ribonuclease H-like domain [Lasallia pustulata]